MRAEAFENPLASAIEKLPSKIREQIEACPVPGQGVHHWLFKTALLLQKHRPEEEIFKILSEYIRLSPEPAIHHMLPGMTNLEERSVSVTRKNERADGAQPPALSQVI